MKKQRVIFFVIFLVSVVVALSLAWGQVSNLSVNNEVTAKIKAFDKAFLKTVVVYPAGTREVPTALFFDVKGGCARPCKVSRKELTKEEAAEAKVWGKPLSEAETIYEIKALDAQVIDQSKMPFPPRALNIVDSKGQIVGYVYTGLPTVTVDRQKDGTVIVYPPTLEKVK